MIARKRHRTAVYIALWLLAFGFALLADAYVASHIYSSGTYDHVKNSIFFQLLKAPGTFYVTLLAIALAWRAGTSLFRAIVLLCSSAAIAGLFYSILKWTFGRPRPISNAIFNSNPRQLHFFDGGWYGLFRSSPDLSFPSGHACLAFATATALSMCIPRWAAAFYTVAAMVGMERVLEGAHYVSDVVAGAGFGILAALVAGRLCDWMLTRSRTGNELAS